MSTGDKDAENNVFLFFFTSVAIERNQEEKFPKFYSACSYRNIHPYEYGWNINDRDYHDNKVACMATILSIGLEEAIDARMVFTDYTVILQFELATLVEEIIRLWRYLASDPFSCRKISWLEF